MYFKTTPETPSHEALSLYFEKYDAAKAACDAFAERNGYNDYGWNGFLMIGVQAIKADNPPAGWRPSPKCGMYHLTTQTLRYYRRKKGLQGMQDPVTNLPQAQ